MIKVYKTDPMDHTVFGIDTNIAILANVGVHIVNEPDSADIIVTAHYHWLRRFRLRYGRKKKYLVWTSEPRYDTHFHSPVGSGFILPKVAVMNVYTRDIFTNNYALWGHVADRYIPEITADDIKEFPRHRIVALMTHPGKKGTALYKDGQNIDLIALRTAIATDGWLRGRIDVFGRNWPDNIGRRDQDVGHWHARKLDLIAGYHFNLCFENTTFDYYCTEKILDSINGLCLPIYFGRGNKIYEDFPKESFLDYAEIGSIDRMYEVIDQMSLEEYVARMNRCVSAFNRIHQLRHHAPSCPYIAMILQTAEKLKRFASGEA